MQVLLGGPGTIVLDYISLLPSANVARGEGHPNPWPFRADLLAALKELRPRCRQLASNSWLGASSPPASMPAASSPALPCVCLQCVGRLLLLPQLRSRTISAALPPRPTQLFALPGRVLRGGRLAAGGVSVEASAGALGGAPRASQLDVSVSAYAPRLAVAVLGGHTRPPSLTQVGVLVHRRTGAVRVPAAGRGEEGRGGGC